MPDPRPRLTLIAASLAFFLISLDILIVNVALSSIRRDLGGGTAGQQWVVDGYTLMFAALLLLSGNLSDRLGAKRTFACGVAAFLLASIGCALAPTIGALIAARFVQGATASLLLPASLSLVREAFPESRERARALGVWAVGGAVAGAVGPLLGGALTALDWRLVFVINLPICAAMLVLLARVAPSRGRPAPFDWPGQVTAITGLAALTWGLIAGGGGFGQPAVIAALVLAVAAIAGFLVIEHRVRHPMMPPVLFRTTNVRIAVSVGFAFILAWFGTVFLMSLYLQQQLGLSPALAGLAFLPAAVFSFLEPAYAEKYGVSREQMKEVMTHIAVTVEPETTIAAAAAAMVRNRVHRLPVAEGGKRLVGLVSSMDIVRAVAELAD